MMFEFVKDETGKHQIGGDKPADFKLPDNEFMTDFQYLGYIDNTDEAFLWVPFKTHLICPIYLDIDKVFLDYSNPNVPTIISPEDTALVTSAYDDLDRNTVIIYEAVNVAAKQVTAIDDMHCIGIAGELVWEQSAEQPRCPKSGRPMKFLCALMSFGNIKTRFTNIVDPGEDMTKMTFWGDGNLYVFIEPTARTICYFIQNT